MDNSPRIDAYIIQQLTAVRTIQKSQNKVLMDLHRAMFTGNGRPAVLSTLAAHETRLRQLETLRKPWVLRLTLGTGGVATLAWVVKALVALGTYLR